MRATRESSLRNDRSRSVTSLFLGKQMKSMLLPAIAVAVLLSACGKEPTLPLKAPVQAAPAVAPVAEPTKEDKEKAMEAAKAAAKAAGGKGE
jgi:hypothetical protein